jgi:hypothetical protein
MAKADLLARMRATCDALTATFRLVQPQEWALTVKANGFTAHDYLNYAMGLVELTGNSYLQSLRMDPVLSQAELDAEARRNAERRKGRAIATDFDDFLASVRGLLILIDMANDEQIAGMVLGRTREAWFDELVVVLHRINVAMQTWLTRRHGTAT